MTAPVTAMQALIAAGQQSRKMLADLAAEPSDPLHVIIEAAETYISLRIAARLLNTPLPTDAAELAFSTDLQSGSWIDVCIGLAIDAVAIYGEDSALAQSWVQQAVRGLYQIAGRLQFDLADAVNAEMAVNQGRDTLITWEPTGRWPQ